jgi:hypothetical protein
VVHGGDPLYEWDYAGKHRILAFHAMLLVFIILVLVYQTYLGFHVFGCRLAGLLQIAPIKRRKVLALEMIENPVRIGLGSLDFPTLVSVGTSWLRWLSRTHLDGRTLPSATATATMEVWYVLGHPQQHLSTTCLVSRY